MSISSEAEVNVVVEWALIRPFEGVASPVPPKVIVAVPCIRKLPFAITDEEPKVMADEPVIALTPELASERFAASPKVIAAEPVICPVAVSVVSESNRITAAATRLCPP